MSYPYPGKIEDIMIRNTKEFKHFSIDLIEEYSQVFGGCNWYTITPIHLHAERDLYCGQFEIEVIILGLGVRLYWSAPTEQSEANFKRWEKAIKKFTKDTKKGEKA